MHVVRFDLCWRFFLHQTARKRACVAYWPGRACRAAREHSWGTFVDHLLSFFIGQSFNPTSSTFTESTLRAGKLCLYAAILQNGLASEAP